MKILLIGERNKELDELRLHFRDSSSVSFIEVDQARYVDPPPSLDGILLTLPAAEQWSPDFRLAQAQILRSSERDRQQGIPPFIVTGINLGPEDPKDLPSQLRIFISRALQAVKDHNQSSQQRINRLGIWIMDLTRCASVTQASEMLKELIEIEMESD
ncbi:MAG TPA: hypothetical protein VKR52_10005 [Terracidiphilus sp.]|nr:hypothetical protein [Terracidiphilus sp.]